jgi:hypothetical protein
MSDEVPDSAGGAVRAFLGALGFIVALIGAEMMAEKTGDRIWIGLGLVIASLPVFLSAVMWKWFRQWVGKLFADRLVAIANDPRWWIISFFLALFSMRLVMFAADFPKLAVGIIVVLTGLIAWGYFSTSKNQIPQPGAAAASPSAPLPSQIDGQTRLDLIHLLDFSLTQSTLVMLDRLIELATQPEVTDQFRQGEHTPEAQQARQWYVRFVSQEIAGNFNRRQDFLGVIAGAEGEIDHDLERLSDQALPGESVVALRRRLIVELQFRRALQFLKGQRREVADNIAARRRDLAELLNLRQQGTTGR